MKFLAAALFLITLSFTTKAFAVVSTPEFQITSIFVSEEGNMAFRISGFSPIAGCSGNFAYVDERDSASKSKISSLLTAFASGKKVYMVLLPVDYYNNGTTYCRIIEFGSR